MTNALLLNHSPAPNFSALARREFHGWAPPSVCSGTSESTGGNAGDKEVGEEEKEVEKEEAFVEAGDGRGDGKKSMTWLQWATASSHKVVVWSRTEILFFAVVFNETMKYSGGFLWHKCYPNLWNRLQENAELQKISSSKSSFQTQSVGVFIIFFFCFQVWWKEKNIVSQWKTGVVEDSHIFDFPIFPHATQVEEICLLILQYNVYMLPNLISFSPLFVLLLSLSFESLVKVWWFGRKFLRFPLSSRYEAVQHLADVTSALRRGRRLWAAPEVEIATLLS